MADVRKINTLVYLRNEVISRLPAPMPGATKSAHAFDSHAVPRPISSHLPNAVGLSLTLLWSARVGNLAHLPKTLARRAVGYYLRGFEAVFTKALPCEEVVVFRAKTRSMTGTKFSRRSFIT